MRLGISNGGNDWGRVARSLSLVLVVLGIGLAFAFAFFGWSPNNLSVGDGLTFASILLTAASVFAAAGALTPPS
jgi:hypothetical protein